MLCIVCEAVAFVLHVTKCPFPVTISSKYSVYSKPNYQTLVPKFLIFSSQNSYPVKYILATAVCFAAFFVSPTNAQTSTSKTTTTWPQLAQNLYKNEQLGEQYRKKDNFEDIWRAVQPTLEMAKTEEDKVRVVYNFINKNVEWNGEWNIYATESLNKAFQKRSANSAELNLMLVACLNAAGIRALPMFVSTREHGKVDVNAALASQFNHLICYTESNGAPRFLDVGDVYRPVGMLRTEALNNDAWVLDINSPKWVKTVPTLSVRQTLSTFSLSKEGDFRGRFVKTSKGYESVVERNDQSRRSATSSLKKEYQGIRIDSVTTYNLDANLNSSFKRSFHCFIPQAIENVDNKMEIRPLWHNNFDAYLLTAPSLHSVDFAYPVSDLHVFNLAIPEGASVDKMPKDESLELADKGAVYQFTAVQSGDIIQLTIRLQIDRLHFDASEYTKMKEFFERITAKQAEKIVLKNVRSEPLSSRR